MKRLAMALFVLASVPSVAFAARLQDYLVLAVDFFEDYLVPLTISLAVLFFFINIVRYFLVGSANEDGRKKSRSLALWGVLAFFLILALWGAVNLFVFTFGIGSQNVICPDYINCNPSSGSRSGAPSPFSGNPSAPVDPTQYDRDFYGRAQDTGSLLEQELRDAGVFTEDALKNGFWSGTP